MKLDSKNKEEEEININQFNKEKKEETDKNQSNKEKVKGEKEKKKGRRIFLGLKILFTLIVLGIVFIFLFFKTSLFQKYKELWVQTAMTTMNHQYLATWFLSDEEIAEIMKKLEVENNENSDSNDIMIVELEEKKEITVERITGKGYVGFVMIVPDASKVKLVDGRLSRKRFEIK